MVINMLKAVSKMLEVRVDTEGPVFEARVSCAKTMLDEIIIGMVEDDIVTKVEQSVDKATKTLKEILHKPKPEPEHPPYRIAVDKDKKLLSIEGMPMDTIIKLDGKPMTHAEAIGRTFKEFKYD